MFIGIPGVWRVEMLKFKRQKKQNSKSGLNLDLFLLWVIIFKDKIFNPYVNKRPAPQTKLKHKTEECYEITDRAFNEGD